MLDQKKIIQKIIDHSFFIPIVILILTIISYGLFIPFLGFYMDDWYIIWFKHTFGASQFIQYFSIDRPLESVFFIFANGLAFNSISPIVWQIITLVFHWLSILSIWIFLKTLWPKNQKQINTVAFLAAVYPGFTQSNMIQYSFHFFCLACLFLSFTLTVKSIQNPKKYWIYMILSILFGLYAYAGADFFAGLELIRPVIIWIAVSRNLPNLNQKVKKTGLLEIPYFVIYLFFLIWRVFFYESLNHKVALNTSLIKTPIQTIMILLQTIWQSGSNGVINSWVKVFNLQNFPQSGKVYWLILVIIVFLFISFWFIFQHGGKNQEVDEQGILMWRRESIILALWSLIVAVIPFWAADLQVGYVYPYDRFLLAYLFGSCLLITSFLATHKSYEKINLVLICVLLSLGVGMQIANTNRYKNQWANQKELYWQIVWRMPELKKGTTLWTYQLSENAYYTGPALSSQLNWTYGDTDTKNREIEYNFIIFNSGQKDIISNLLPDQSIESSHRTYQFHGNTSNIVFIYKDSSNCLRVIDDNITPVKTVISDYNRTMFEASSLSNLNLISVEDGNSANPVTQIVGAEPLHDWCYFFEKAELARQMHDFSGVIDLLHTAQKEGFKPRTATEWYPFIDAFGRTSNWSEAEKFSRLVSSDINVPQKGVCNIWYLFLKDFQNDEGLSLYINNQLSSLGCD